MKKQVLVLLVGSVLFFGCVSNEKEDPSAKEMSKARAIEDFNLFYSILKEVHPSLNIYLDSRRFSFLVDSIRNTINGQISLLSFFNKLNFITNEIGCSHTDVDFPDIFYDSLQRREYFFPYPVKWIEGKLLVNATGQNLPQGTEIISINGESVKGVINNLMAYNVNEGIHRKTQQYLAGENFGLDYFFKYGPQENFNLKAIDTVGAELQSQERPVSLSTLNKRNRDNKYFFDQTDVDYNLEINNKKGWAYLKLTTFSFEGINRQQAFENFCSNSFELLKSKKNIHSLIIDLRENGGGSLSNCFLLYSYLAKKDFNEYEKVTSKINKLKFVKYLDPDFAAQNEDDIKENLEKNFTEITKDGFYKIPDTSITKWEPDHNRFEGNVFVIVNSTVASSASYFTEIVKNSERGKIIGEETCGGSYSGNGFKTLKYVLPNSKLVLEFPYAHLLYSYKTEKNSGHGVLPDFMVPDNFNAFKKNQDIQFDYIADSLILNTK